MDLGVRVTPLDVPTLMLLYVGVCVWHVRESFILGVNHDNFILMDLDRSS